MKVKILCFLMIILSIQSYAQNNACINSLDNLRREVVGIDDQNYNMLTGAAALEKRGMLNEIVNIETLSLYASGLTIHAMGLGNELSIRQLVSNRSPQILKDIDEIIVTHAAGFYETMIGTKERFDNEIPILKNNNITIFKILYCKTQHVSNK